MVTRFVTTKKMHNKNKKGTYGCPYVPRKYAESASCLFLRLILGLIEPGDQRVEVAGRRKLPVGNGALDFCGLAQLHMEELLKALHDGREGRFLSGDIADRLIHIKSRQEFLELYDIGIPIQRGIDGWSGRDEEIRIAEALLVVILVQDDLVPGILDGLYDKTFFFLATTLSKAIRRLSKVSDTSRYGWPQRSVLA